MQIIGGKSHAAIQSIPRSVSAESLCAIPAAFCTLAERGRLDEELTLRRHVTECGLCDRAFSAAHASPVGALAPLCDAYRGKADMLFTFSHNLTRLRQPNADDNDYRDIQSRFAAAGCRDYLLTTYNAQSTMINVATAHSARYFLAFLGSGRSNRWPDPQLPGSFAV